MGCGGSERVPGFLRWLGAAWWRGWVAFWIRCFGQFLVPGFGQGAGPLRVVRGGRRLRAIIGDAAHAPAATRLRRSRSDSGSSAYRHRMNRACSGLDCLSVCSWPVSDAE